MIRLDGSSPHLKVPRFLRQCNSAFDVARRLDGRPKANILSSIQPAHQRSLITLLFSMLVQLLLTYLVALSHLWARAGGPATHATLALRSKALQWLQFRHCLYHAKSAAAAFLGKAGRRHRGKRPFCREDEYNIYIYNICMELYGYMIYIYIYVASTLLAMASNLVGWRPYYDDLHHLMSNNWTGLSENFWNPTRLC